MIEIFVNTKSNSYPIFIENEPIADLKEKIFQYINGRNYLVVFSQKVEKLYGKIFDIPKSNKFVLKDGEEQKNIKNFQKILDIALKKKLDRKSVIIAIGGGVIGDIVGFAASVYMRGIDYVQVPTTLLACTDSSVGGKTAIDTKYGKNLIGSFYQPSAVFINPKFIKTLDKIQFYSGMGEVIKYAFIENSCNCNDESNLTNFLNEKHREIFECDEKVLAKLIEKCISLKKSVVEKDEKEQDYRMILNFGHTYGHAIEKINNYKKYTHGESVIEGIKFAFNIALKKNIIDKNYNFFAMDMIEKFKFRPLPKYNIEKMLEIMSLDKKANSGKITLILPNDYSKVGIYEFYKEELI